MALAQHELFALQKSDRNPPPSAPGLFRERRADSARRASDKLIDCSRNCRQALMLQLDLMKTLRKQVTACMETLLESIQVTTDSCKIFMGEDSRVPRFWMENQTATRIPAAATDGAKQSDVGTASDSHVGGVLVDSDDPCA